jgi:hypothetical protein
VPPTLPSSARSARRRRRPSRSSARPRSPSPCSGGRDANTACWTGGRAGSFFECIADGARAHPQPACRSATATALEGHSASLGLHVLGGPWGGRGEATGAAGARLRTAAGALLAWGTGPMSDASDPSTVGTVEPTWHHDALGNNAVGVLLLSKVSDPQLYNTFCSCSGSPGLYGQRVRCCLACQGRDVPEETRPTQALGDKAMKDQ